jgi:phosphate transport system permease protein
MSNLRRRRIANLAAFAISTLATAIGLAVLCAILWTLLSRGVGAMSVSVFTQMTPAPGSQGGLLNAIVGSLLMSLAGIGLGAPIGVLAGTFLSEYGRHGRLSLVVRFINDVLLSAPSIIVGLYIYALLVVRMGHFSALAGAAALAVISLPIMVRTTEDILRLVPETLRENSAALGAQPWHTILHVIYPSARSGLLTGLVLAVARISGETAPLLFTALNNQFWSVNFNKPMANLPTVIFQYAMSPYVDWQRLAWVGAMLISLFVLLMGIAARSASLLLGGQRQTST